MNTDLVINSISNSGDLEDLEKKLLKLDLRFENRDGLIKTALNYWREAHKDEIGTLLNSPPVDKLDDLPCTTVESDGLIYKIHGIVHGGYTFFQPSKDVIAFVKERTNFYKNTKGEDYVYEEGLANPFGLDIEREMSDITDTIQQRSLKIYAGRYLLASLMIPLSFFGLLSTKLFQKHGEKINPRLQKILDLHDKAMKDINYLPLLKNLLKFYELPVHVRIDIKRGEGYGPLLYVSELSEKFASSPDRSEYMVAYMKEVARRKGLHTIHSIVGLGHEEEIAYFIQNPEKRRRDNIDIEKNLETQKKRAEYQLKIYHPLNPIFLASYVASIGIAWFAHTRGYHPLLYCMSVVPAIQYLTISLTTRKQTKNKLEQIDKKLEYIKC